MDGLSAGDFCDLAEECFFLAAVAKIRRPQRSWSRPATIT
jgi:hypothetical protein